MISWTEGALDALNRHNESLRARLLESGADPDEVAADLKRHIDEELVVAKVTIATRDDVKRILDRFRLNDGNVSGESRTSEAPSKKRATSRRLLKFVIACCILFIAWPAALIVLYWTPSGHDKPAILGMDQVVSMAAAGDVRPGTGVIRWGGSSGDPLRVVVTGYSIHRIRNPEGREVHRFRAEGRLTDAMLTQLQFRHFAEPSSTSRFVQLEENGIPLSLMVLELAIPIAAIVICARMISRSRD